MKKQQQDSQQPELLKYKEEHTSCTNYATEQKAIIQIYEEKAHRAITKSVAEKTTLVFVLKGVLHFTFADAEPQDIQAGEMFLLPAGNEFFGVAETDVSVVACFLTHGIALCNQFTLKNLYQYAEGKPQSPTNTFAVLPICDILRQELETTKTVIQTGVLCYHYQLLKRDTFLLMLRAFYDKNELANLFSSILSEDFNFKTEILQLYSSSQNVNELIEQSGLSATTFNRKFKAAFHTTPSKWLAQKKKESLLNEIRMTDLPLKEIAEGFNFTPNYLIKFCKDHFGQTPTELRSTHEE